MARGNNPGYQINLDSKEVIDILMVWESYLRFVEAYPLSPCNIIPSKVRQIIGEDVMAHMARFFLLQERVAYGKAQESPIRQAFTQTEIELG